MQEDIIYKEFIAWLGKTWWTLPESDHLLPMIKSNYSVEDAEFLTGIPHSATSPEELASIKNMTPDELEIKLDQLSRKGMLYKSVRGDSTKYRLNDSFLSHLRANLWSGRIDDRAKKSAPLINKYFLNEWFDQYDKVRYRGLRTVPIEKTIIDPKRIMPFDDVVKVIESFEYYTVSHCPCRLRHNLDPSMPDCSHPVEVCLHFDDLGHYIVENGLGREITKEETYETLKKAADSGLVHALSNWQKKPDTICNCCSCCCMFLESFHKLGHEKSIDPSNYMVAIDATTCKSCALCMKRCPMDALQLKVHDKAENKFGKAAFLDPDRCIGCGVCVHKCPTDSMKLIRKDELTEPPKSVREYMKYFMEDKLQNRK